MMKSTKLLKLLRDREYSIYTDKKIAQVCKPYEDKEAIAEKLIALIEPCKTEEEAMKAIAEHYPLPK